LYYGILGSGKDGRVTKGDVLKYLQGTPQPSPQPVVKDAAPTKPTPTTPTTTTKVAPKPISVILEDHVVALRGFQRAMAHTMNHSLTIPHLGYSDEVEMDNLIQLRENLKEISKSRGVKLSYMPFLIKACSLSMKKYPFINSKINAELTEVTCLASHNIAIAVATPTGLVVPNIKHVESLSVYEVAEELNRIVHLATDNKLPPKDLEGSTFTLSNIGAIGGTYAHPVLVAPQVCIGAFWKGSKTPQIQPKRKNSTSSYNERKLECRSQSD